MSTIQSSSEALGLRSALSCGTARFSTVRSIEYRRHGRAMTARPIHSRRVALGVASRERVIAAGAGEAADRSVMGHSEGSMPPGRPLYSEYVLGPGGVPRRR